MASCHCCQIHNIPSVIAPEASQANYALLPNIYLFTYSLPQALDIGTTVNSRAGFGPMAGALASKTLMVRKTKRKQVQHNEKIGRISDKDRVSPHSHDEAVIHYSITSLANLITDHRLRQNVQTAIQTYITTRLHRISEFRSFSFRF